MFREEYRKMNERIFPDQEIVNKVIESINKPHREANKSIALLRKSVAIAAVIAIITLTVTTALAANVPIVYQLMYAVSPSVAQFFMPVRKSCVDNGIKMEVVSAYIHDNTAEIYITMQDITGDRIDNTIDLYDSYSINRPFDSSATCELVGFDEASKTATFLISITEWGNKKIEGDKITFSVREFISHKRMYKDIPVEVDMGSIESNPPTMEVNPGGGGGRKYREFIPDYRRTANVLVPSDSMGFQIEDFKLTGIGYIDGFLHVQASIKRNMVGDNFGYFILKDKNGKEINCVCNFDFSVKEDDDIKYTEYIFEVPPSEIEQYSLYGYYVATGLYTKGYWQVTFPLEKQDLEDDEKNTISATIN
ncbi:MAG TPA: DUF4179 domain-containing protein [Acetivibrio sp.]|nr:DUF4179 domain-containing protein [Acetivibrio sp.]